MEIKIDFLNEADIIEKYDETKISSDLLEYLIKKAQQLDKIKIVINNKCQSKIPYKKMLKQAFLEEYQNAINTHNKNNHLQILFLLLGSFAIFMSFQIKNEVWQEIFLIGGWVPIWEMVELELFNDVRGKKRKKALIKLINSEIITS